VSAPTASDATFKVDGPASDAADPVSPPSAPGCGTERPDVSGAREPDGLAIDTDGTLYYSHVRDGWEILGRIRPGGAAPEPEFARVVRGTTPWGLAIDDTRRRLYFASSGAGTIYVFDLNQPRPAAQVFLSVPTIRPNDLAVGPNGDLYYSDHADNHVYRVDLMGAQRLVTTAPIGDGVQGYRPSALAFGPSGDLFVGMRGWGNIHRLTLTDGLETRRQIFGAFVGWANGLAFDQQGRLYVGLYDNDRTTDVVRLDPTGVAEEVLLSGGRFSSLAFGRGALSCNDLYVSDRAGGVRRLTLDAPGLRRP
ncbi:MAG TPA: SMP-30/gluconolactonase/LRE family protein, partial [Polyangia bacterium]